MCKILKSIENRYIQPRTLGKVPNALIQTNSTPNDEDVLLSGAQSDGLQYLNTGFIPQPLSGKTTIVITALAGLNTTQGCWGTILRDSQIANRISMGYSAGYWFGGSGSTDKGSEVIVNKKTTLIWDRSAQKLTVDGIEYPTVATYLGVNTTPAFLFNRANSNLTPDNPYGFLGIIHEYIEESAEGEVLHHWLPYLNLDNEVYFKDLVSNKKYFNIGAGNLTPVKN